ncbi:EAL domain-containing protein [Cytobacillus sp. Hz8]|uniref:EAL domain-containing protein n=1 Tax=Cytobacillus sp. Hz8 TaxID=3347168 RepID=UPI0035DB9BC4
MKWLNSIAARIWLTMNIIVLIGIVAISLVHLIKETDHLETNLRNEGITAANTLSSAIGLNMLKGDYSQISPLAYSLLDQPNMKYVIIKDIDGRVINQKGETSFANKNQIIVEKVPILYFQKNVGEIEIGLDTSEYREQINSLVLSTILTAFITSLISFIISFWFSKRLTLPLKRLVAATRQMTRGNRNIVVTEGGTREMNELLVAFNKMSQTVQNYENTLVEKIEMATNDLSEKVKVLEVMSNISQSVIENDLNKDEIIKIILDQMLHYTKVDRITLSITDEMDGESINIYELDESESIKKSIIHSSESPIHQVMTDSKPLIINNLNASSAFSRERELLAEGFLSTLIVPLLTKYKFIGTINFSCKQKDFFNEEIVKQVSVFINHVAMAIDRASLDESLHWSAYHDYLTGLPNNRMYKEKIDEILLERKKNQPFAIMFMDIDRFKMINDTLGHKIGDLLLIEVSKRLQNELDEAFMVSRMSGDEFMMLIPEIASAEETIGYAEEILEIFKKPFCVQDYELHITISIGIAVYPYDGEDPDTLIKHADTAMYRVKEQGKNNFAIYSPLKSDPSYDQLIFENDLRKALNKNEFTLFYQPKINIFTGEISGMEALIRWIHPEKGIIPPLKFIPVAEETGLIIPIGEFVLRQAAMQIMNWQKEGLPPISVAVNLSTRQFLQSNLVSTVESILKETELPPHLLELEITESMTLDIERALGILEGLKKLGVSISIDDFGTGYSSLHYLQQLPIDRLKIDQSFVRDITTNENNAAIVSTIIHMANNLKLRVTAEGVETESQTSYLQNNLCEEIQGYYFSHPLPADEFLKNYHIIKEKAKDWKLENAG